VTIDSREYGWQQKAVSLLVNLHKSGLRTSLLEKRPNRKINLLHYGNLKLKLKFIIE
jgi:hypothetical protein